MTLEQKARRAARRVGLIDRKSRWRSLDNLGGFTLLDERDRIVVGALTPKNVIDLCTAALNHKEMNLET